MPKNHWVLSRPKRKLILIPDLLKIFSAVSEGKQWHGNRQLQLQFEQTLTDSMWKAQNLSEDGSGGRTYAVLLFMLGFWYEDDNGVQITLAGDELINGNPPVPIITKQLFDLQYPSPYSIKPNVAISRDFKIWPFRFTLKLFTDLGFQKIHQEEIAFCLVPFAKKMTDLVHCAELIREFRNNPAQIKIRAVESSGTTEDNLRNIGNTAINQIEYTGFFHESQERRSLEFIKSKEGSAVSLINDLRQNLIPNPEETETFQKRYGSGLDRSKDYRHSTRQPMELSPNERLILGKYYVIASNEPIRSISEKIIGRVSYQTGAPESLVRSVLEKIPIENQPSEFENTYLKLSIGGRQTALDFERKTGYLFKVGFGFDTDWVGNKQRHPDIIIYIDKENKKHGIIDTKASKKYNLSLNHKNLMAYTYIKNLWKIKYKDEVYQLCFYNYVAGGFNSNIQVSFDELVEMAVIPGSYITAKNLLKLLQRHNTLEFTSNEMIELFGCNNEINPNEVRRL